MTMYNAKYYFKVSEWTKDGYLTLSSNVLDNNTFDDIQTYYDFEGIPVLTSKINCIYITKENAVENLLNIIEDKLENYIIGDIDMFNYDNLYTCLAEYIYNFIENYILNKKYMLIDIKYTIKQDTNCIIHEIFKAVNFDYMCSIIENILKKEKCLYG